MIRAVQKCLTGHTLPLLSVRIHSGVRRIKVRMDGPIGQRWMDWARWWWINNRGPVPAGKRVGHLDGDTLNDDPSNLALLTPGDVVFLAHERDPKMSARNFRKMREATRRFNHESAMARRAREILPSYWYPVDVAARTIVNRPHRKRWQIYVDVGLTPDGSSWWWCCHHLAPPEICKLTPIPGRRLIDDQAFSGFQLTLPAPPDVKADKYARLFNREEAHV